MLKCVMPNTMRVLLPYKPNLVTFMIVIFSCCKFSEKSRISHDFRNCSGD